MAISTTNEPIILDSTGQSIAEKLHGIADSMTGETTDFSELNVNANIESFPPLLDSTGEMIYNALDRVHDGVTELVSDISAQATALSETNSKLESVTSQTTNLTDLIERDTASGSIVEVNAEYAAPVEKLVVNIEPQQDLHGYDNPWPVGGGKNKFDPSVYSEYLQSDGKYRTKASNLTSIYIRIPSTLLNTACTFSFYADMTNAGTLTTVSALAVVGGTNINGSLVLNGSIGRSAVTFTPTSESDYIVITFGSNGANEFTFYNIQLEASSAVTDYSPYSNICPISGWTGAEITRRGKNLTSDDIWSLSGVSRKTFGTQLTRLMDFLNGLSEGTYTVSVDMRVDAVADSTKRWSFGFWGQGILIDSYLYATNPAVGRSFRPSFTITKTALNKITSLYIYASSDTSGDLATVSNWQIEKSSTATAYESYVGSQISVTFPTSAGTVYGGTLTVNPDRTGALVVDKGVKVLNGTETWAWSANNGLCQTAVPNGVITNGTTQYNNYTKNSTFRDAPWSTRSSDGTLGMFYGASYLYVKYSEITSVADATAFFTENPTTVIYDLATPITYTFTASEVSGILSTIRGTNYIWANTGDIAELKYQSGGFATTNTAAQMIEKSAGTKADVITETASGPIVSFSDGADGLPVKSLTVNIEPQQDLHGYDHPWPEGGSAQLLPTYLQDQTMNGVTFKVNSDGSVTVNGTATNIVTLDAPNSTWQWDGEEDCWLSGCPQGGNSSNGYSLRVDGDSTNKYSSFEVGSGIKLENLYGDIANTSLHFRIVIRSGTVCNNLVFKPMLNKGLSAQPFTAYSNICPISGWTGAEVTRTGKNLLGGHALGQAIVDAVNNSFYSDFGSNTDGDYVSIKASINVQDKIFTNNIKFKDNTQYTFILRLSRYQVGTTLNSNIVFSYTDGTGEVIYFGSNSETAVITVVAKSSASKTLSAVKTMWGGGITYLYYENCGIFEGDLTVDDFVPYTANQLSVTFPSSTGNNGTVYGGTLTINPDRTGTLVVDKAIVTPTVIKAGAYTSLNVYYPWIDVPRTAIAYSNGLCNKLRCVTSFGDFVANISFMVRDTFIAMNLNGTGYSTSNEANAAGAAFIQAGAVQFCYEIAAPITYTLTSTEISGILTTLYGTNNIWSDAGDVTVEYPVDTKLYIQQLTKPTEDDMTADNAIAAGTFFMIGNTLYLATTQIAAGATITPGTNATKLSLADALNQLNA